MSRFLFISWDGGGNQPPARHIAAELAARGHHTQWLTLPTTPIDLSLVAPPDRATVVFGQIMANPTHVQDVRAHVDADPADVLVVDCLLFGALAAAQILQVPTGCLVHTLPGAFGGPDPGNPNAPRLLTAINDMRARLGLAQVNDPWQTWTPHTTIVASFPDLDLPAAQQVAGFRWIGPIVDRPTATDVPAIP
jgi:hypothetical protein